jgi:hypothetical protein
MVVVPALSSTTASLVEFEEGEEERLASAAMSLLREWHKQTRAILKLCTAQRWSGLHKGVLNTHDTAASLLIAMRAVAQWKFYLDHEQVSTNFFSSCLDQWRSLQALTHFCVSCRCSDCV